MKHVPAKSAHRVAAVAVALISVAVAMAVIVADVGLTTATVVATVVVATITKRRLHFRILRIHKNHFQTELH
jgi:hypothetical protein